MDQSGDRIFIYHTDPEMDRLILGPGIGKPWSQHFSQNEDFFIQLNDAVEIPSLPIHHDIRIKHPTVQYRALMKQILIQLKDQIPEIFSGMNWYFDATETIGIGFFQILRLESSVYLVLLRIDLTYRPATGMVITAGSNDQTPRYKTRKLFIESDIIPVQEIGKPPAGGLEFRLLQTVSETWIGETGRGYFVQGIWLDRELTKFFSRLFVTPGKRLYPYYPLNCKFRCVCFQPFDFGPEGRKTAVAILHNCRKIIETNLRNIEASLQGGSFAETLPEFIALRQTVSAQLVDFFQPISIQSYLNPDEFKEYTLTYETI